MNRNSIRFAVIAAMILLFVMGAAPSFVNHGTRLVAAASNNVGHLTGIIPLQEVDSDLDGLLDSQELALGTDPMLFDSDGDGLGDGWEVARGLDPLSYTMSTGEATEVLVIILVASLGFSTLVFIAVHKKKETHPDRIDGMVIRRYSILAFAFVFALVIFLGCPPDVNGPVDPGPNGFTASLSETTTYVFNVTDSPYYTSTVNVELSYNIVGYEVCRVRVSIYNETDDLVDSEILIILPSSGDLAGQEWVSRSWTLEPGSYDFVFSYTLEDSEGAPIDETRIIKTDMFQQWRDGRNYDQQSWASYKSTLYLAAGAVMIGGLCFFFYREGGIRSREHIEILYPELRE